MRSNEFAATPKTMKQTAGLILALLLVGGGIFYAVKKQASRTEPAPSGENQTAELWEFLEGGGASSE